ncbi:FtsQ-type POTRA domain-containing protein [Clostridium sp. D2Q-11]|uniref:FtsQ-type POTRA domain-containing protein n=1 Tax=Anaeromonas frigoriresistens TaxID=2683708 RepID=A0A942ZAC1_9FIRM|nr:FtsQ-type POTRA domain-containing protein [Anaeromonas frigoriresistens]MBS4540084.1 FtsQ-type POTRA domain-containing protein [Anaeromonas frigoriresistens]
MGRESRVDRKVKKKKRLTLLILSLLLLAILFIIVLTQTTFFHIKNIDIEGNNVLNDEKVLLASGLNIGENVFKIDIDTAENNLLRHPYIKDVEINRRFPDRVNVELKERKETLVYNNNGTYIYIDNEGYVLNILSELKEKQLPILKSDEKIIVKTSEKINFEKFAPIKKILQMLNLCNKNKYSFVIQSIVQKEDDITLVLNSGTNIAFGRLNDIEYKLRLIDEIVNDLQKKEILAKEIHLNKGKNPIIVK